MKVVPKLPRSLPAKKTLSKFPKTQKLADKFPKTPTNRRPPKPHQRKLPKEPKMKLPKRTPKKLLSLAWKSHLQPEVATKKFPER